MNSVSGARWSTTAVALLVLAGCAVDAAAPARPALAGPSRWRVEAVSVCSDADLESQTLGAIDAWSGMGPELVYCGPCSSECVGEPERAARVPADQRGMAVLGGIEWACGEDSIGATLANPGRAIEATTTWLCRNATARGYDLQSIVTHELGHALGIGHAERGSGDVMAPDLPFGPAGVRRELSPRDIDAAAALYE